MDIEAIADTIRERIRRSGIERTARELGVGRQALANFLLGSQVQARTVERICQHFREKGPALRGGVKRDERPPVRVAGAR